MLLISYARDKWVFLEYKQRPGARIIIIELTMKPENNDQEDQV